MENINKKFYKLATLLIMLCLCFVVIGCKKSVQSSQEGWTCICGTVNNDNFCSNCGKQKGEQQEQNKQVERNQESNMKQAEIEEKTSNTSNPFANAKVGDYVNFGNYPQTAEGEEKPIEWQVLAKENNNVFIISRYGLEVKRFDSRSQNWANSEIRKWLNGEFYSKAFNDKEKKYISPSNLSDVGTSDNVFLLSKEEAETYFANDDARRCKPTEYAVKNRACVGDFGRFEGYGSWWLRSLRPDNCNLVYNIYFGGSIHYLFVDYAFAVARPALWINL